MSKLNAENELGSLKNTEATEWRDNFRARYKGRSLPLLLNVYLNTTQSKTQYDNEDLILDYLIHTNNNNLIDILKLSIKEPTELEVIDFVRYCAWYCRKGISPNKIAEILSIPISDECRISRNGIEFVWNKRKDAFTQLERNLSFELAVAILCNPNTERIYNNVRNVTYAFLKDTTILKTYFVVEVIKDKEERIISFRFTSEKEYNKIKEACNV